MESIIFLLGKIILGFFFIMMGMMHFKNRTKLVAYGESKGAPMPKIGVPVTGLMMLLGGLGILLWRYVDVAVVLLVVFLVPTSFIMHKFWREEPGPARMNEMVNFMKNMAITGSLLIIYSMYMI